MLHRLGDERERREVQHGAERVLDGCPYGVKVTEVTLDEASLRRHRLAMSALEVVKHDDVMAAGNQMPRDDRADVACAACDEQSHRDRSVDDVDNPMSGGDITDLESRPRR